LLTSQDNIIGSYKLNGLYIIHQNIARETAIVKVQDIYDLGIAYDVDTIKVGEIYRTEYKGPYGHIQAQGAGVALYVDFYENNIGVIEAPSTYPNTIVNEDECTTADVTVPITDNFTYATDFSDDNHTIPSTNILGYIPDENITAGFTDNGIPIGYDSPLPFQGEVAGSISLAGSEYFDSFPLDPYYPTICDEDENCFDVILPNSTTVSGGEQLPGMTGGYVKKGCIPTIAPMENGVEQGGTGYSDLYIEWHAIDGSDSQSGLGDIIGSDEDGDGTDFDAIWTMETIAVTNLDLGCGYEYDVAGDITQYSDALGMSACIDPNPAPIPTVDVYVMHPDFENWGNFLTYNAVIGDDTDDSNHDYDPNNSSLGGRLVMHFDNLCIKNINVRHIMLEFLDQLNVQDCPICPDMGDMNGDGGYNVLDIVTLANCVLASNCAELPNGCAGDMNGDGGYNVLDIVTLANCVLAGNCGG